MTGRVDTAKGRKLLAEAQREFESGVIGQDDLELAGWLAVNAEGLLAAAEERDTLREALNDYDGTVKQAVRELGSTNRSKVEFEELIADAVEAMRALRSRHRAFAAVEARLGEPA